MTSPAGDWKNMSSEQKDSIEEFNEMLERSTTEQPHPRIELWTADEVAECLPYQKFLTKEKSDDLYRKLWDIVNSASKPTPIGGDGTGNTVETPEERLTSHNDDKVKNFWSKLNAKEKEAINKATEKEFNPNQTTLEL